MKEYGFTEIVPGTDDRRLTVVNSIPVSPGLLKQLTDSQAGHSYAGLLAGLTSASIATPIELLKVQLQLQTGRHARDRQFKNPLDCARQIIRARGVLGLYSGFSGSLALRTNFFFMFGGFEVT